MRSLNREVNKQLHFLKDFLFKQATILEVYFEIKDCQELMAIVVAQNADKRNYDLVADAILQCQDKFRRSATFMLFTHEEIKSAYIHPTWKKYENLNT